MVDLTGVLSLQFLELAGVGVQYPQVAVTQPHLFGIGSVKYETLPIRSPDRIPLESSVTGQLFHGVPVRPDEIELRQEREIPAVVASSRKDDARAVARHIESTDEKVLFGNTSHLLGRDIKVPEMHPSPMVLAIGSFIDEYRIGSERELLRLFVGHRLFGDEHDALPITGPFVVKVTPGKAGGLFIRAPRRGCS